MIIFVFSKNKFAFVSNLRFIIYLFFNVLQNAIVCEDDPWVGASWSYRHISSLHSARKHML